MHISRGLLVVLVTCASGVVAVPQGPVKGPKAAVKELLSATDEKSSISLSPSASSKFLEYASRSSDVPQPQAIKDITNISTSDQGDKSGSFSKWLRKFFAGSSEKSSSDLSNRSGSKYVEVRDYLLPDPEHPSKPWVGHWRSAQIAQEQEEKKKKDKKAAKEAAKKQKYEDKKKKQEDKKKEHEDKKEHQDKKENEDNENGVESAVDSSIVPRAAANTSVSAPTLSSVTEPVIKSASSSLWHKLFGKKTEAEEEEAAKKRQEKKDAAKKAEEDNKKQRHEDFLSEVSVLFNPKTKKPQARAAATISAIPLPTSSKDLSQPAITAPSSALLALVDGKKSEAQLEEEKNRPKQPYPTAYSNLASQNFSKIVTRAVDVGMEKRTPAPHKVKTTMATKTRGWSPSLSAAVSSRIYEMRHRTPKEILKDRKKLEKEQLVKLAPEKPLSDLDKWIQEEENKHQPANGYAKGRRLLF